MIAQEMGIVDPKPMSTRQSLQAIVNMRGWSGMYTGFGPHFSKTLYSASFFISLLIMPLSWSVRDTLGTGLYFAEYDALRTLFGRSATGEQGEVPSWLPVAPSLVPFFCGSVAGVSSWALIYRKLFFFMFQSTLLSLTRFRTSLKKRWTLSKLEFRNGLCPASLTEAFEKPLTASLEARIRFTPNL